VPAVVLDAGTRIEIYRSSFDIALPALTPGTIRRLAPVRTRRPKLPLTADLRVIDPGREVEHARRFIHGVSFEPPIDFDVMRNSDGTGILHPAPHRNGVGEGYVSAGLCVSPQSARRHSDSEPCRFTGAGVRVHRRSVDVRCVTFTETCSESQSAITSW
jgi:hypothetical protein